jgi:hypothetical protein
MNGRPATIASQATFIDVADAAGPVEMELDAFSGPPHFVHESAESGLYWPHLGQNRNVTPR